ncbi:hypothetical protein [Umezawaea sp. Da 62-37]|uniref:hypothetical protein n=1 Tax=Umezawaea sp. Da 62-37 TaxID=3075927 RepID=UPI0028F7209B|nr:hypothetical protein [Umezawaea sp. Da 62-37]WNV83235.1 hypothetical protein RM788_34325 [Umezawaea sp. Da 62-37]
MSALVAMTELVARVLREHADLPAVSDVRIEHRRVSFYVVGAEGKLPAMARWAHALQASVLVAPQFTTVEITASTVVEVTGVAGGVTVEVWTHLGLADLLVLAREFGVVVDTRTGPVEITPQRLLPSLDDATVTDRVM